MVRECSRRQARRAARRPESLRHVLGRFHEVSIQTADIRESVEFYERLGFEVFGQIDGPAPMFPRYFMQKRLPGSA